VSNSEGVGTSKIQVPKMKREEGVNHGWSVRVATLYACHCYLMIL